MYLNKIENFVVWNQIFFSIYKVCQEWYYWFMKEKVIKVYFFKSIKGREPVREWLKSLSKEDKTAIGKAIKSVEFSWPIGLPLVRSLNYNIREVRIHLKRNRIVRVLFYLEERKMILLHGFVKKTQKTPQSDIVLAFSRLKQLKNRSIT